MANENYINVSQLNSTIQKIDRTFAKKKDIIVDKYSDLTIPTESKITYVLNLETIGTNVYNNGFYIYNINETTPSWRLLNIGTGDFNLNSWAKNTEYKANDFVYYNKGLYICLENHISNTIFEDIKWLLIVGGSDFELNKWIQDEEHLKEQYYIYDYKLYRCLDTNIDNTFDETKYELIIHSCNNCF